MGKMNVDEIRALALAIFPGVEMRDARVIIVPTVFTDYLLPPTCGRSCVLHNDDETSRPFTMDAGTKVNLERYLIGEFITPLIAYSNYPEKTIVVALNEH